MPSKFILSSTATIFCGVFIGYFGMQFVNKNSSSQSASSFASLAQEPQIAKLGADQISKDYFDLRFENNEVAEHDEKPSIVKVKLIAIKDVPAGLNFQWVLGSEITVANNQTNTLSGSVPAMQTGEFKEFEITVLGFSKQSASHVSFSVSGTMGSHEVKRNIISSSRPEDSYEYVVQQQALYQEQFVQKGQNNKAQKPSSKKGFRGQFDPEKIVR